MGTNFEVSLKHVDVVSELASLPFALIVESGQVLGRVCHLRDHIVVHGHVGVEVGDAVRIRISRVSLQIHEGGLPKFGVPKEGTRVFEQI